MKGLHSLVFSRWSRSIYFMWIRISRIDLLDFKISWPTTSHANGTIITSLVFFSLLSFILFFNNQFSQTIARRKASILFMYVYTREHRSIQVVWTGCMIVWTLCVHACIQYTHKHRLNMRACYSSILSFESISFFSLFLEKDKWIIF